MNYIIRISKKYSKVLNLLGGNPRKDGKNVICDEYDFVKALENLRAQIDEQGLDEKIESTITALGKTPKTLYYELITTPFKDELKENLCSFFWGGKVKENEIIDEIERRLSEYGFSFNDVVNFEVQSEPEMQMFGRFWSMPTENAFVFLNVIDDDEDQRVFLLQVDSAHNYEFEELEDRGS